MVAAMNVSTYAARQRHKIRNPRIDELPGLIICDAKPMILALPLPPARGGLLRHDDIPILTALTDAATRYRADLVGVCWLYTHRPPERIVSPDAGWLKTGWPVTL